jgi:hypothetical protein
MALKIGCYIWLTIASAWADWNQSVMVVHNFSNYPMIVGDTTIGAGAHLEIPIKDVADTTVIAVKGEHLSLISKVGDGDMLYPYVSQVRHRKTRAHTKRHRPEGNIVWKINTNGCGLFSVYVSNDIGKIENFLIQQKEDYENSGRKDLSFTIQQSYRFKALRQKSSVQ